MAIISHFFIMFVPLLFQVTRMENNVLRSNERIWAVDALRGFAVMGIVLLA